MVIQPQRYSKQEIDELVKKSPYYKATLMMWIGCRRLNAGPVQKWVDHSISVTINLPSDVTEELVGNLTWRLGRG